MEFQYGQTHRLALSYEIMQEDPLRIGIFRVIGLALKS
jgi:hypothetical protein